MFDSDSDEEEEEAYDGDSTSSDEDGVAAEGDGPAGAGGGGRPVKGRGLARAAKKRGRGAATARGSDDDDDYASSDVGKSVGKRSRGVSSRRGAALDLGDARPTNVPKGAEDGAVAEMGLPEASHAVEGKWEVGQGPLMEHGQEVVPAVGDAAPVGDEVAAGGGAAAAAGAAEAAQPAPKATRKRRPWLDRSYLKAVPSEPGEDVSTPPHTLPDSLRAFSIPTPFPRRWILCMHVASLGDGMEPQPTLG